MSIDADDNDKVSKWTRAVRRNKPIAAFIFLCILLIGAATVTDSARKLASTFRALFINSDTPMAQSTNLFRELKKGDAEDIRWMVERLIKEKAITGFVWGDYQINMTMNIATPAPKTIAFTGLLTNIKGPQFSSSDSYELTYDLTPTNRSTQFSFHGPGIPGAGMDNMRMSEAAYYQEQWDEVRLMILTQMESNMTIKLNRGIQELKKK